MRSTAIRSLSIAALAAAIALLLTAATAAAAPRAVEGGELDWGVKESFRSYIETMALEGQIDLAEGATEADDGTYRFPLVSGGYEATGQSLEVQAEGSVRFSAYYAFGGGTPVLDITIKDPRVVLEGGEGKLFADVITRNGSLELEDHPNTELAELDPSGVTPVEAGQAVTWTSIPAVLTAEGEPVFGNYPAGEELDPVTVDASFVPTSPVDETEQPDGSTQAPTDTITPPPILAMPKLRSAGGTTSLGKGGAAKIATISCPSSEPCVLKAPRHVKLKVGGRSFSAKVIAPRWILSGKSGKVTVKVPRGALVELAGGQAKISLKLVLGTGPQTSTQVVKATLKARGH
ncbi:MAG TPA: HtaA domain-containing protein [Solirubrobacterales bacterium]|jgi:hypothetical protein|nr:HtaA domain-containing protein [Solirubrobacterales bacterium]